jgi:hypothetical protein
MSFEQYEIQLANNNGNCGFWGLDTETECFRVPTYNKISFEAGSIDDLDKYIQDQIVNITGNFKAGGWGGGSGGGTFTNTSNSLHQKGAGSGGQWGDTYYSFAASKVVYTGDRVKGRTITLRAMVQLATQGQDISVVQYTNQLNEFIENKYNEIATDLQPKANIDLNNVLSNIDYVIESWTDGASWYRKYRSGWIEQGGYVTADGVKNFLIPFTNTNYNITFGSSGTSNGVPRENRANRTLASFYYTSANYSNVPADFRVCGY